tara:strand:- start:6243 stop:6839 length:597 start_codon:yes stop_codon:yes gene_type:complete
MTDMPSKYHIKEPRWLWIEHDETKIKCVSANRRLYASHVMNYNLKHLGSDYELDNYCVHIFENNTGVLVNNLHGAMKFYGVYRFVEHDEDFIAIRYVDKLNNLQNMQKTEIPFNTAAAIGFELQKAAIYSNKKDIGNTDNFLKGFTDAAKDKIYKNYDGLGKSCHDFALAVSMASNFSKTGVAHIMKERAGMILMSAK